MSQGTGTSTGNSNPSPPPSLFTAHDVLAVAFWILEIHTGKPSPQVPPAVQAVFGDASSLLKDLRALRVQRNPAIGLPGPIFDSTNTTNWEALLAYMVGDVDVVACDRCRKGLGPFLECVLVPRFHADGSMFLGGSCASCHYGGHGKECSSYGKYH
jgi:hypothetical protein